MLLGQKNIYHAGATRNYDFTRRGMWELRHAVRLLYTIRSMLMKIMMGQGEKKVK